MFNPEVLERAASTRCKQWTVQENESFFNSVMKNGRNWAQIAKDVGTRKQEQVRGYYYRLLKRIKSSLELVDFAFDATDRVDTLLALLSFWDIKRETRLKENTNEFAEALAKRIASARRDSSSKVKKQRKTVELAQQRHTTQVVPPSKLLPTPDKVVLQLLPKAPEFGKAVADAGFNPKLQLTLKPAKPISAVIDHLTKKWTRNINGRKESVASGPIKLHTSPSSTDPVSPGWGIDDQKTNILSIFHKMNCPRFCKLEYSWCMPSYSDVDEVTDNDIEETEFEENLKDLEDRDKERSEHASQTSNSGEDTDDVDIYSYNDDFVSGFFTEFDSNMQYPNSVGNPNPKNGVLHHQHHQPPPQQPHIKQEEEVDIVEHEGHEESEEDEVKDIKMENIDNTTNAVPPLQNSLSSDCRFYKNDIEEQQANNFYKMYENNSNSSSYEGYREIDEENTQSGAPLATNSKDAQEFIRNTDFIPFSSDKPMHLPVVPSIPRTQKRKLDSAPSIQEPRSKKKNPLQINVIRM